VKGSPLVSRPGSLICPLCEAGQLHPSSHHSMRCEYCSSSLNGAMLKALRQITDLPDAMGTHACEECGHPEMRCLPDGTFHCPACRSEVLHIGALRVDWKSSEHGEAYWCGWLDGRYGELSSFADNPNLAKWEAPSDRLDYYQGHRAGSEARRTRSGPVAQARKGGP
jgi:ribosomal protein L37AE/L43A